MKLYAAQQRAVDLLLTLPRPIRHVVGAHTGCGKTAMSIATVQALGCRRILVICPAIVRRHWTQEFLRWAERQDVGFVEMGRDRKSGTKKALLARDWSYSQNVQVISYDLVKQIDPFGWDAIIIDEFHALGDPLSMQSKALRSLVHANPAAHVLGLTATLIPTNAKQVWHPMWLLQGSAVWGKPAQTGGISWQFVGRYLETTKNEYGTAIGGLRPEASDALREMVSKAAVFVTRQDISGNLPPLCVKPLHIPKLDRDFYKDWLAGLAEDVTHAIILPYNIEEAKMVAGLVRDRPVFYVDGSIPVGTRAGILSAAEASDRCILVATQESVSEGIRFMWAQEALITQPQASPGRITQLFGRFQSVGSTARPQVTVVIEEAHEAKGELLMERVADINKILAKSSVPGVVEEVFAPRELTEERITDLLGAALGSFNDAKSDWDSDDDESEW